MMRGGENGAAGLRQLVKQMLELADSLPGDYDQAEVLDLPRIVVIGNQSSGKSSVIESLVGREFIPRDLGILTKCPLDLRLCHQDVGPAVAVFPADDSFGLPERRFEDFRMVEREIAEMTERFSDRGFTYQGISVSIYSEEFPDLQLIDLPGFIEIARGGQSNAAKEQIEEIARRYVEKDNTIILAVSEATVDISNSKALHFAQQIDPDGLRTIGVLTKVDQVEKGTEREKKVIKVLQNKVLKLKRGFFGLINRSQRQVDAGISVADGLKEAENLIFQDMIEVKDRLGVGNLLQYLSKELELHICQKLPGLKLELVRRIKEVRIELENLGDDEGDGDKICQELLGKIENEIRVALDGSNVAVNIHKLEVGARINEMIKKGVVETSWTVRHEHEEDAFLVELETADRNSSGLRDPAFPPREVLEIGVRLLTSHYSRHLAALVDKVANTLLAGCCEKVTKIVSDRPKLARAIENIFEAEVEKYCSQTKNTIQTLIECEYEFLNLEHPRYKECVESDLGVYQRYPGTSGWFALRFHQNNNNKLLEEEDEANRPPSVQSFAPSPEMGRDESPSLKKKIKKTNLFSKSTRNIPNQEEEEKSMTPPAIYEAPPNHDHEMCVKVVPMPTDPKGRAMFIKKLVLTYMEIVDETVQDLVPKLTMKCLVHSFREGVAAGYSLYRKLEDVELLMKPNQAKIEAVKRAREKLDALENAMVIASKMQEN